METRQYQEPPSAVRRYLHGPSDTVFKGNKFEQYFRVVMARIYGLPITYTKNSREQLLVGESLEGYEAKADLSMRRTGRLSIEVAERDRGRDLVPSGILRHDNTVYYVQGDFLEIFLFHKKWLVDHHATLPATAFDVWPRERPTVKKFYLPVDIARMVATVIVIPEDQVATMITGWDGELNPSPKPLRLPMWPVPQYVPGQ
jgi:hypothetical protein